MISVILAALALTAQAADAQRPAGAMRLVLSPMAAPTPALKYQLLPEVRELQAGNPVQWYLRCFAEQRNFFFNKEVVEERNKYRTMPLKDLPIDKIRNYGGSALTQADWGARLDTPDWQVLDRVRSESTDLQLPEIRSLRILAAALQVRFRGEVARRDFDAAISTAKTLLALARHLGECPTTEASRLGLAVAHMGLDTLEEFVQQPGSPNLYWALTDLPTPLVDVRKGLQGERAMLATELRAYRDDVVLTDRELDELIGRLSGRAGFVRQESGLTPRNLRSTLAGWAKDTVRVDAARKRLIESGIKSDLKFPAMQVILLDEKREFESLRDDEMKLLGLTPWQIEVLREKPRPQNLFAESLPRVAELRLEQANVECRVAVLRHVEALRVHASGQGGSLPHALKDVALPLPTDPITGKPFGYRLDDSTAYLSTPSPRPEKIGPAFTAEFEITIRK
jgi:hypothetical protein